MIIDLFSKRRRRLRGEMPDVYQYDDFPQPLRVQIILILREAFEPEWVDRWLSRNLGRHSSAVEFIVRNLRKEYGVFQLHGKRDPWDIELFQFFLEAETDRALDCVELSFSLISEFLEDQHWSGAFSGKDLIGELNGRMKEAGFGYRFEDRMIVRVDSEYLHEQAVKPALTILHGEDFEGANAEFRSAHKHFRHSRHKECVVDCLKCFESTLKIVCDRQGWEHPSNATANKLIEVVLSKGLLPTFTQSQLSAVQQLLASGIPTVRNKLGGHGQGGTVTEVPEHMATYALNLTATTVRMIADAERALGAN